MFLLFDYKEEINATYQNRLPVNSPNFAESPSPRLELRQLALYFLSSKTHRSTYAINTSQSFFERVWSTQLCSNKKSQSCLLCFRCSGFNVFLISRLNGTFTVLKWCLQQCLQDKDTMLKTEIKVRQSSFYERLHIVHW